LSAMASVVLDAEVVASLVVPVPVFVPSATPSSSVSLGVVPQASASMVMGRNRDVSFGTLAMWQMAFSNAKRSRAVDRGEPQGAAQVDRLEFGGQRDFEVHRRRSW
ncbi:MAG: hypothetical protein KDK70_17110, partial [Myxococcales bacterium]|nr:hypothetical protein [Myxococcales bacterium]